MDLIQKLQILFLKKPLFKKILNLTSVYCLYGTRIFQSLLFIPYAFKFLSEEYFAKYMLFIVLSVFITSIVEFGFSSSGSRKVALNHNKNLSINNLNIGIFILKTLVAAMVFISLFFLNYLNLISWDKELIFLSWLVGTLTGIVPTYFFIGTRCISKLFKIELFFLILSLIFVSNIDMNDDKFIFILLFFIFGRMIVLLISITYIKLKFTKGIQNYRRFIKVLFLYALPFFKMKFMVILYTSFLPVFLSTFAKPIDFAVYCSIEKLIRGFGGLITQSMNAILPLATVKLKENFNEGIKKLIVLSLFSFVILLFVIVLVMIFSSEIIYIYLPGHSQLAQEVFIILMYVVPFILLSSILTYGFFIPMNLMNIVNRVLFVFSLLSLPLGYVLYDFFGILGFSISIVFVEFSIAILLLFVFFRRYAK